MLGEARQSGGSDGLRSLDAIETETTPIVFLPGLGGDDSLLRLCAHLERAIPIAYLNWPWRDLLETNSYPASLVADIRRQIDSKVPNGPFYIGGYSMGAPLAFACALEYQAEGRQVAGLAILDAPASDLRKTTTFLIRMRRRFEDLWHSGIRYTIAAAIAKYIVNPKSRPLLRRIARLRTAPMLFGFGPYLDKLLAAHLTMQLFWPWWLALLASKPRLSLPTLVFCSYDLEHLERPELGWGDYCDNVEVVKINCSHEKMQSLENMRIVHAEIIKKVQRDRASSIVR